MGNHFQAKFSCLDYRTPSQIFLRICSAYCWSPPPPLPIGGWRRGKARLPVILSVSRRKNRSRMLSVLILITTQTLMHLWHKKIRNANYFSSYKNNFAENLIGCLHLKVITLIVFRMEQGSRKISYFLSTFYCLIFCLNLAKNPFYPKLCLCPKLRFKSQI